MDKPGIIETMSSDIRYWLKGQDVQNAGDYLSEFIFRHAFYPIGIAASGYHLAGSVIDDIFLPNEQVGVEGGYLEKPVVFWGCGVRDADGPSSERLRFSKILAVRGPLSVAALGLDNKTPIGDSGFLVSALYEPQQVVALRGKALCIPHFHDSRTDAELLAISHCDVVLRPNIPNELSELERFIDVIASSDFVLSASLHGVVIAAAYHRRFAFWNGGEIDLIFKWQDLAASMSIPTAFATTQEEGRKIYNARFEDRSQIPSMWPLLARAPFLVRPEAVLRLLLAERRMLGEKDVPVESIREKIKLFEANAHHYDEIVADLNHRERRLEAQRLSAIAEAEKSRAEAQKFHEEAAAAKRKAQESFEDAVRAREKAGAAHQYLENELRRQQIPSLRPKEDVSYTVVGPLMPKFTAIRDVLLKGINDRVSSFGRLWKNRAPLPIVPTTSKKKAVDGIEQRHDSPVVLIIDSIYPRPDQNSGSIDAANFIKMFQNLGFSVIFIGDSEFSDSSSLHKALLEKTGVRCICSSDFESVNHYLHAPSTHFDIAFLSRVYCGGNYFDTIRRTQPHAKVVFNTVDLHHLRETREAKLKQDREALNKSMWTRERELYLVRLADATIVVSSEEQNLLQSEAPGSPVFVIPIVRECPGRGNSYVGRSDFGFIGGFLHSPNIDAVHFLLDDIWPIIRRSLPDAKLYVLGADMPTEISTRQEEGFVAVGYVTPTELSSRLDNIRVMIAPLRYGAGAKGKVVTSLSYGVPCVVSPIASEGMGLVEDQTVAVGETAEQLASQAIDVYTNERKWMRLSDAGIALVKEEFSFERGQKNLEDVFEAIGVKCANGKMHE